MRRTVFFSVVLIAAVMSSLLCSKVDFTNPLDKNGSNFKGDSAAMDDNGDGIANWFDPTWPPNRVRLVSTPKIIFTGPDTVIIAQGDPKGVLATLSVSVYDSLWPNLKDSLRPPPSDIQVHPSVCNTYTITYNVTNPMGYKAAPKTRTIIVDCKAPEIALNGETSMMIPLNSAFTDPGVLSAYDEIDGDVTSKVAVTGTVNTAKEGDYTLTYTVSDRAGNPGKAERAVTVYKPVIVDRTPPTITLIGGNPFIINQNAPLPPDPGCTAYDSVDLDLTSKVKVSGWPTSTSAPGQSSVSYSVTDNAGNVASVTRIVTIKSVGDTNNPPEIILKGKNPDTVQVGGTWTDPGFTARDYLGTDISSSVTVTNPLNTKVPKTYTIYYAVTDSRGKSASYARVVVVVGPPDRSRPVITLEGCVQCTVAVGTPFKEPGVSAYDTADGVITSKVQKTIKNASNVTVDSITFTNTIGSYTLTYNVTDLTGNAADLKQRSVRVRDTVFTSLLDKYKVPSGAPLPSLTSKTFATITKDGTGGPDVTTFNSLAISWDLASSSLFSFGLNMKPGIPPYYLDVKGASTVLSFNKASPGFTLSGSKVNGLDGAYYVTSDGTQFVWVKTDGSFALIFNP